ncbi:maternal protein tudor isoform X2 [Diachasma alloeum]|uniref:maternal protein tudor isoform X2 n=1 Tax=Diachasma alloeum TaxID=454923 RepID=UPI0007381B1F|nr:maternal protein tudor isoform X2 [Diachasma alloeum]
MTVVAPGREFTIYVTHVDTEGPLLRVWGQIDKDAAMKIESLIASMNVGFQKGFGAIQRDALLTPHTTCCAYHDDAFYRARIMRPNSGHGTVLVHFQDYGNMETVSYESIRILNDTQEGIQLQILPPVATDFIMADVLPFKDGWDQSLVDHIKHTLRYNEMPAVVCSVLKNKKRMLKLFFNGEDYSEYMINKRMALPATSDDLANLISGSPSPPGAPSNQYRQNRPNQPHYPPQSHHPPPHHLHASLDTFNHNHSQNHYNNNFYQKPKFQNYQNYPRQPQENWRQQAPQQPLYVPPHHCPPNPAPNINSPRSPVKSTPKTAQSMVNRVLKYRRYPVLVSFVEDGPLKFAVQPEENLEELTDLMKRISSCPLKLLSEPPIPGSVCLGRYSQDGTLRRAVVRSVTDSLQAKVFYIDYGSSEILSHSDIYELPLEFAHPYVFSIRFTLSSVQYLIVSEQMKKYFQELVEGKRMILDVVPPEDSPLMQYGHLWDNDNNILEMLIARFPGCTENWPERRPLNRGVKKMVHACYVEGCSNFYVQLDDDTSTLERLTKTLEECIKTAPPVKPASVRPGYKCLAHCSVDSQWYRAKVIRSSGNQVTVHYVDYGNNELISISALRAVGGEVLTRIPALAIRCALNDFQGKGLLEEVDNLFEKMVMDKVLEMVVLDHHAEGIVVKLFDKNVQPHVDVFEEMNGVVQKSVMEAQMRSNVQTGPPGRGRSDEKDSWKSPDFPKKTCKDEENEHKHQDLQAQRTAPQEWTNAPQTDRFPPRNDRNDRPSRDYPRQDRNENQPERSPHDFAPRTSDRSSRSKPMTPPSRSERNSSMEKAWSDKDSDTSSRSGGRRGERPPRGGGTRPQRNDFQRSPRDSESSESSYKSPRPSSNSNNPGGRSPRNFSGNSRRQNDNRDSRRLSSTPSYQSPPSSSPSSPPKPQKPQQLRIPPPNVTLGAIKNCELIHIVSPLDFWVILHPDYQELDGLMMKISAIYKSGGEAIPQASIKPGTDCIAQFSEDSEWYRATVEEVSPSGAKVRFVDYANCEVVPFDKIKGIKEEVCKLPAQAVRVKLLAAVEKNWDPMEIDAFTSALELKPLEAEFVGLERKIYTVLLREVVDGVPQTQYINEQYSNGADLMGAKELSRNRSRKSTQSRRPRSAPPDYAPMDQKWKDLAVDLEERLEVMVTWSMNPHNFYCQSLKAEEEFKKMMHDIQRAYVGRTPVEEPLEVGTAVIAVFADDGAFYRAEVLELNKLRGNIVRYVDFGNCAMVETKKTFRVERQFMEMPKQAFNCTLKNVIPVSGNNWTKSNSHEIDKLFNVERFKCCFHEVKDNKYTVSMMFEGKDLAGIMVERGLADFAVSSSVVEEPEVVKSRDSAAVGQPEEEGSGHEQQPVRIDISRLEGQTLRVKVSNVEGPGRFHVLLPSAGECEKGVADFMDGKSAEVLPKLSKREVFLGSGCLVETKGGWQRAVVISTSRSTGFDVRLIDTGAKLVIPMDCMLALPPQLAVMQNQAVECYVKNAKSDADIDKKFKATVGDNEVIIRVENVDNNRLAVSIFNTSGHKIQLTPTDPPETISSLLPMPIIHSANKVTISHINHSKSLYLQRVSDIPVLQSLLDELFNYYSTSGRPLAPQRAPSRLCAAQSEDENWYRAKILEATQTGALVQYLDYGNPEEVPSHLLKELEPQHMIKPQLSLEVSLSVTLKGSESEQSEALKPLLLDKEFTASLYNIRSKWIVELEDPPGTKISETLGSLNLLQPEEEPKKLEIDPSEPEDLIVGGKYKIAVTHADNPAQFYIQRLRDVPTIDDLQEKLQSEVSGYSQVEGIPEENLFCAATYSADGLWYRAEVIDADEDIVTVRFVDFGNTDSITDIKSGIRHLPESMKSIKRYGIKCRLDLIPSGEEDWSEGTCEKFLGMATAEEFIDAVLIADGNPKRLELFVGDENIGDKLVEEKLAIKVHGVEDIFDEIVHRELDPRSAFVSHINSPSEFWVQEEKFVADLETIADRFVVADMFGRIEEVQEGALCVAKFPEDQNWYRARIISHGDTGTNVIYIDYGNSAVSTEIRQIPEDLAAIPPLSRKCCLPLPEGVEQWSEKACEEFSRMADDGATIFILEVVEEGETSKVKLILEEKDISEELGELCEKPVAVIEERLSPLGEETSPNVVVSHVVSPSEFWLQADYKMADLDVMADHLENAHSFLPLNTLSEGTICAARFPEDNLWYRAKILCHSESETEVLYIDYGNSAVTSELRALPEDIIKIPHLSMFSSLKLPEDLECWSQEACEKFIELVADGATMFEYEELAEDDPSLIKLSLNGQDVVEILAPLCKKKQTPEIDEELREEVAKIQNMRDSVFDETSDSFFQIQHEVNVEKTREEIVSKFGDMIIQTESITEHVSSSTSGIEGTGNSDQSSTNISVKMDSSPDATLQKPEEGVAESTEADTLEGAKEGSSIPRELTADDIVELYSQPPSEGPDEVGDDGEVGGSRDTTGDEAAVPVAAGEVIQDGGETEAPVAETKNSLDILESCKSITEVSGVDLSTTESLKDDKESPEEENHHSTLLDDQTTPDTINKLSQLNLNETTETPKSSLTCDEPDPSINSKENLSIDLSQVSVDADKPPNGEVPPKSPGTPKTPHCEKLVSGVVTDHRILQLEKENDDEVLTVEKETISK